ncbi:Six-hairpin glycosidase-like protein [Annulohypoxylon maeteangense]|uniref:Six-hairpin glycosidase-like protein n=1 Tax=Annulohypoxylon maeteangense TaxID=1927788 RepID=UPI0020089909|nr:Six-hairpin glycosidase-like protein [Annulohypoxylon maeteangense]KAI0889490.1 Six-hairpin glycosidase-like protein [Annulohypoxylon maeteangense]
MARTSYNTFVSLSKADRNGLNEPEGRAELLQHSRKGDTAKGKQYRRPSDDDYLLLKVTAFLSAVGILWVLAHTNLTQRAPSHQWSGDIEGTSFLDHEKSIGTFSGKSFLRHNIPFIDIPDSLIQDVYYYRWTSIQRNLRYIRAGTGYMCTEFVQPVGYAQAFGSIDAAAGHQIDESRWLRDTFYGDDYIQLYTRGPADALQYTQWILDATSRRAMVTGDSQFFSAQLNDMIRIWHEWDQVFDPAAGLYYYQPVWDAQELSLPGFVADPNGTDWTLRKDGPDTFRPSHNAYMVANARAISRAAVIAHDRFNEHLFSKLADDLEAAMYKRMWAPEQQFFMDIIRPNNPSLTRLTGREQVGLFPYRFGIGLNESYTQPAVDAMFDPEGFLAPYGPTTLEIRDPWFMAVRPDDYCCYWNGMSWPYSTGHTLKSLAEIYRSGTTNVTAEQYYQYLQMYARTQQKNGQPYVAESHYPFLDTWSADGWNHSEHYDHSTNNDDVITGLLGIIPQQGNTLKISPIVPRSWTYFALENLPYHGHLVTVLYDKHGSRYKSGRGLTVFVDGRKVYNGHQKSALIPIPPPIPPNEALINIAANPAGPSQYPTAEATFTNSGDFQYKAIDGVLFYDSIPDNRWTNYGSPNTNDTLTITFARPRNITSVTLALYSDIARGGGVDVPARIEIYGSNGLLVMVNDPSSLLPNDRNELRFGQVETQFVAVNMYRKSSKLWVGICELEVWTPPNLGPVHYAADAYLTGGETKVIFDNTSTTTSNGAVVGGLKSDSNVAFSGIMSNGGWTTAIISYSNAGNTTVEMGIEVNQVPQKRLYLPPSKGKYVDITATIVLASGKNYVSIRGGSDFVDAKLESLSLF